MYTVINECVITFLAISQCGIVKKWGGLRPPWPPPVSMPMLHTYTYVYMQCVCDVHTYMFVHAMCTCIHVCLCNSSAVDVL